MISYLIDYDVPSTTARGAKSKGSIYIRGVKGDNYDSFKFVLEKSVDFHDTDIEIILKAYEEAFKPKMGPVGVGSDSEAPSQSRFGQKPSNKITDAFKSLRGQEKEPEHDGTPQGVLESHGCNVFVPGVRKDALTWDYLAGYDNVKRDIEDTVLLALTHGHVYD
jgi:hypothetical protein